MKTSTNSITLSIIAAVLYCIPVNTIASNSSTYTSLNEIRSEKIINRDSTTSRSKNSSESESESIKKLWFGEPDHDLLYRPVRLSIVPGLSTNGLEAPQYTARFSLNFLAGYNGALDDGVELGLVNINRVYTRARFQAGLVNISGGQHSGINLAGLVNSAGGPMQGFQLSGIANVSGGPMQGLQLAGIVNTTREEMQGIQLSGIGNVAGSEMQGLHYSGVFNASGAEMEGIQLGGVLNVSGQSMSGIQLAGVVNGSGGSMEGIQLAGVVNASRFNSEGVQMAGVINASGGAQSGIFLAGVGNAAALNAEGVFVSGIFNVARGPAAGIQVTGVANVSETFEGIQVSGLVNTARKVQGIQIAPLNIANSFEGLPVGLISWYDDGRKNIDVHTSEAGFIYAGLKTGTMDIYNMISVGYNVLHTNRDVWSTAWSIGDFRYLDEAWGTPGPSSNFIMRDVTISHVHDGEWFGSDFTRTYSYRYLFGAEFTSGLAVYGGPSLNMLVSNADDLSDYHPYSFFDTARGSFQYRFWVGFSVGLMLF
jgi:hypothetical protein